MMRDSGGVAGLVRVLGDGAPDRPRRRCLLDRYFAAMPRLLADDLTALWVSRTGRPAPGPD